VPIKLPPSLYRSIHTVDREVTYARSLTMEQRHELLDALCESALQLLQDHPQRERLQRMRTTLPESTKSALERLRRELREPPR
jgi:hypothetical protein